MALDSTTNFVRQSVGSSVGTNDPETIDVSNASVFADPSVSQYDIVIWDSGSYGRPDQDPDVEILTVTSRDTTNDTLTVSRGKQGTSNNSHPTTSDVIVSTLADADFNVVKTREQTVEVSFTDPSGTSHTGTLADVADVFSGDHADLSNVQSSQHHSKTSSASELSDVSADSVSDAHHTKYSDSEARSAQQSDDTKETFGAAPDFAVRYDSTDNELVWSDEVNGDDVMGIDKSGNLSLQGELTENTTV